METTNQNTRDSSISYMALRQTLGWLGLSLPWLLYIFNGFEFEGSISHFYYTHSSIIFTGFMITFGIFLIFYPGRIDKEDRISDNAVSTIGGIGAILTALIPTAYDSLCKDSLSTVILKDFCSYHEVTIQVLHNDALWGLAHFFCAASFLILMGYMSYSRFTKDITLNWKRFYRFCAFMVWLPLVVVAIILIFGETEYGVLIGEWVSLTFFGLAWLVKGRQGKIEKWWYSLIGKE